jgi:hypothetical protein
VRTNRRRIRSHQKCWLQPTTGSRGESRCSCHRDSQLRGFVSSESRTHEIWAQSNVMTDIPWRTDGITIEHKLSVRRKCNQPGHEHICPQSKSEGAISRLAKKVETHPKSAPIAVIEARRQKWFRLHCIIHSLGSFGRIQVTHEKYERAWTV